MKPYRYNWSAPGDFNSFFGLMLDNVAGMIMFVGLMGTVYGFPIDFILRYMIPGTAVGVLVGDLFYFFLAFRLAQKTQRDVTAMPLGLDTPSTIGMIFFVLGPAFLGAKQKGLDETAAAMYAWHIGICAILFTGLIKGLFAIGSNWMRDAFPRAGLLGSLAAIAIVLIAFVPLVNMTHNPIVGFVSLIFVFAGLLARRAFPFQAPSAVVAVLAGCLVWYVLVGMDKAFGTALAFHGESAKVVWFPLQWLSVFRFEWLGAIDDAIGYMPYILPFAITTVIGGIDCTESAASAGDRYDTRHIIGIEAAATVIAALFGGVIQTTPYIGHPAYKAMGGRAAYTLATAAFVGAAGVAGFFSLMFLAMPEAAVAPILIFIGLEITAQSFHATPRRHYAALAVACLPALAKLVYINLDKFMEREAFETNTDVLAIRVLAGGFIITSLLWASTLAMLVDRRYYRASLMLAVGGVLVLFGVIHSPYVGDRMFWPWEIGLVTGDEGAIVNPAIRKITLEFAASYLLMALIVLGMGVWSRARPIDTDQEFEALEHGQRDEGWA